MHKNLQFFCLKKKKKRTSRKNEPEKSLFFFSFVSLKFTPSLLKTYLSSERLIKIIMLKNYETDAFNSVRTSSHKIRKRACHTHARKQGERGASTLLK